MAVFAALMPAFDHRAGLAVVVTQPYDKDGGVREQCVHVQRIAPALAKKGRS